MGLDCFEEASYNSHLLACCTDIPTCLPSFNMPCISAGCLVGQAEGGKCSMLSCLCIPCVPMSAYRGRRAVQAKMEQQQQPDNAMAATIFCVPCAMAQDRRQLKYWDKLKKEAEAAAEADGAEVEEGAESTPRNTPRPEEP